MKQLRDGPFDFSWGGGAQIRKIISSMSRIEEKKLNITNTSKKKYRAQKISKLAILYIERKIQFFC
jgi:hypothetical protein